MYDMGLNVTNNNRLLTLMASTHHIAINAKILDLDCNALGMVSHMFLDGQVTYDFTQPITRSLDAALRDPARKPHLDSNSPADGALFLDRQLAVDYCIIDPTFQYRYDIPVFTGPLTGLERSGAVIDVEAQGRDVLGMSSPWVKKTWREGTRKTTIIREILRDFMGEANSRIDIPDKASKTTRDTALGPDTDVPWVLACKLASSMGYQLFYDGTGTARMRTITSTETFTFKPGHGGMVKTLPSVGYSDEDVINCVEVWGAKPKGKGKKRVHIRVVADRSHALSPWKLGTEKAPRYFPAFYEDDSLKTNAEARAFGNRMLKAGLLQSVEIGFDSLPWPLGEPGDSVRVDTSEFADRFRVRKFALPLSAAGSSSIGYLKNVKPNATVIRYRKAA